MKAILDFYGCKHLEDKFFHSPLATFSKIPNIPEEFQNKIYDGPQALTSAPMIVDGKPNLGDPRSAWLLVALRDGTWAQRCVQDDDYARIDAVTRFSSSFPPTCFVQGTNDDFVPHRFAEAADKRLRELGVKSQLVLVADQPHGFDLWQQSRDNSLFQEYVMPGLKFLAENV